MKNATWILLAIGGLLAFAMLKNKDTTSVVINNPAPAQGAPQKEPFGSAPKEDNSWIEDFREGVGAARDVFDMAESSGIFSDVSFKVNW